MAFQVFVEINYHQRQLRKYGAFNLNKFKNTYKITSLYTEYYRTIYLYFQTPNSRTISLWYQFVDMLLIVHKKQIHWNFHYFIYLFITIFCEYRLGYLTIICSLCTTLKLLFPVEIQNLLYKQWPTVSFSIFFQHLTNDLMSATDDERKSMKQQLYNIVKTHCKLEIQV